MTKHIESFKDLLESPAYLTQRDILRRDINQLKERRSNSGLGYALDSHASPGRLYRVDYSEFKKTPLERGAIYSFKANLPKTRGYKFTTYFKGTF